MQRKTQTTLMFDITCHLVCDYFVMACIHTIWCHWVRSEGREGGMGGVHISTTIHNTKGKKIACEDVNISGFMYFLYNFEIKDVYN